MYFEYWEHDNHLIELLFDSSMTMAEIAEDMGVNEAKVSQRIKLLGLDYVPRKHKNVSRGQAALTVILKKLIPNAEIVYEHQVGERLRLDIYIPQYKLAVEYHGRQHFEHVVRFHDTYEDFKRAQTRDDRKIELCKEQGITLVAFRYCDELTEDSIFDRLLDAMKLAVDDPKPITIKSKYSTKNSPYHMELKLKRNAYNRELRQKLKQDRKTREQNRTSEDEEENEMGDYSF